MRSADDGPAVLSRSLPKIISVDDHVLEPPTLWSDRITGRWSDQAPRVVRERGFAATDGSRSWTPDESGQWADVWYYDRIAMPITAALAAVGLDQDRSLARTVRFEDVRLG